MVLHTPDSSPFQLSWKLWNITSPLAVSYLLRQGEIFILLFFAGRISTWHEDSSTFAAISLALMFLNVSCVSLLLGMSSSIDTLCSQYNGSKNYREVGIVLQRSLVVLGGMLIPISVVWLLARNIFHAIGTDTHTVNVLVQFLNILAVSLPVRVVAMSYRRFLIAIGISWPTLFTSLALVLSLGGWCYVSLHRERGLVDNIAALAWSSVVSTYFSAGVMILVSWRLPEVQRCMCRIHPDALCGIFAFVRLGLPGCVMICSEWWCYEFLTVLANRLGPNAVTAQTLIFQLNNFTFMLPSSLGSATSTLIGNAMGAGHVALAKYIASLSLLHTIALEALLICPAMLNQGSNFVRVYISDEEVHSICAEAIPVLTAVAVFDGLQTVASGVLRANGRQNVGACVNLGSYYLVGLPLAWYFCFKLQVGVKGLILGIACATALQCMVLLALVLCLPRYTFREGVVLQTGGGDGEVELRGVGADGLRVDEEDGGEEDRACLLGAACEDLSPPET